MGPDSIGEFWKVVGQDCGVRWSVEPTSSLEWDPSAVTGARWFPGGTINYAGQALGGRGESDDIAIVSTSDTRDEVSLTWRELSELVGRLQAGLRARGVGRGDVVAGYLPNIPETLALMLASVGLGAVWTCCAPETGADAVLDRLTQSEPTVLVAINGYRYGDKERDVRADADTIRRGLPTVTCAVGVDYLPDASFNPSWDRWTDLVATYAPASFEPVPADHPLYILYSSGTTGVPKAIVHGHAGIVHEHAKALRYHFDLDDTDRFFWYTTTGWMMWNFCVSGLLVGATVVLHDGSPTWPDSDRLWSIMSEQMVTCAGVGATYIVSSMKSGLDPRASLDLSRLETLGSTGSPLPAEGARWVFEHLGEDILLESYSGGTDVCSGFVGASPLHDVWPGEISCRCLGVRVEVYDEDGHPVVDQEGELVVTLPMPSMPVGFLNDPGDARYRSAYFERFPGVWAHGDHATLTSRGTVIITGRSDGTLNRGGVRMGTAEFYAVVEAIAGIVDSLVVHVEDPGGGAGELWLFVVAPSADLDSLQGTVRSAIRAKLSPRHLPDRVVLIDEVPRTLTGKKLEVPVKKILAGAEPSSVVSLTSMANPESLAPFVALARHDTVTE